MVEKPFPEQTPNFLPMKTCDRPGCNRNVFGTDKNTGKRYCKYHQYLRTDIKRNLRKTSVKERNKKLSRNKQDFDPFQWGFESEVQTFFHVWENSDKKSKISGKDLAHLYKKDHWYSCFAHVLEKKKYPLYRYNPENILLVFPYEHYLVDQVLISERVDYLEYCPEADFNVFYALKEKLKKEYGGI